MAEHVPRSTHKFGGASVKDAAAIRRLGQLLANHLRPEEQAVVVVSAILALARNQIADIFGTSSSIQFLKPSLSDLKRYVDILKKNLKTLLFIYFFRHRASKMYH